MSYVTKVSSKGEIVIPGPLCKKHCLESGTQVELFEYGDVICIAPHAADSIAVAYGLLPASPSLADELLADQQSEKNR
jgi:bifunctional DNA-binding transcriptional regulator/antitoxin component of YhaV-PrlF toxin-antitoxin module